MLIKHNDAKMEAGGITRKFYLTDEIQADGEKFNYNTWKYETVESTTSQKYFVKNLEGLTAADHVSLYINSMGGSVKEALGIYNVLRRCPAEVTAYIDGFAASAASIIAMAAKTVVMPHNTCMMIHNASWLTYGNPAALRKSADDLEVINMAAIQSYMVHAGDKLTAEKLREMLDAETWLTAEECMTYGLADQYGEDVDIQKAAEALKSAQQKTAGRPEAAFFKNLPAALAAAVSELPEDSEKDPEEKTKKPEPPVEIPEAKHSSYYKLLESMTNH